MIECCVDAIGDCDEEAKRTLMEFCDKLPEEDCYRGETKPERPEPARCDEREFDCGDGRCIAGLSVCDYKYDCYNGADELQW